MKRMPMFLVPALLAISAAASGAEKNPAKHQRAVNEIRKLGGLVVKWKDSHGKMHNLVTLPKKWKGGDAGLRHLKDIDNLTYLRFREAPVTDDGLKHIEPLTELKVLVLSSCSKVTDRGLVHLKPLSKLNRLHLRGTPVTIEGLKHLTGLSSLRFVFRRGSKITATYRELEDLLPQVTDW